MRQHNLRVTGSLSINGENVISASELSALSSSIVSRIEGLNPSQIGTGSYTASILSTGGFTINTDTKITGSLLVSNLSGSGVNYISAVSGGLLVAVSGSNAILNTQRFVATAGQTVFNSSYGYLTGLVQVFYNGTKLDSTEFSDTDGNTITLTTGSNQTGDIVEVVTYRPVSGVEQNALRTKTSFTASASQTTFAVDYTPGLIDVYFNGSHLASEEYTANNGTTIVLTEAAVGGEVVDVFVYNNQIGAFSGIGGGGEVGQFAYFSSQSGISGSNVISISGSNIIAGGSIIPSVSGSYDLGSSTKPFRHIYVGTGSIYLVDNQGQVTNTISAQTIVTTDTLNSASIDLTKSLPVGTVSSSAQIVGILSALNSFTASNSTTNTFTASATSRLTSLENKTGSLASTGSNTFYGTQTFSGSVYIANDLIVQGSSSIQYITGSSVNIGTNIVSLNTAFPSVRYAGLTMVDSGSIGGSGSFLYDSVQDEFLFVHRGDGTNVTSSHFVLGPETYNNLGNETYLTCNRLSKGTGKEHLVDSNIFDDGTTICVNATLKGNGQICSLMGNFNCVGIGMVSPQSSLHIIKALGNDVINIGETGTGTRFAIGQEASYTGNYINSRNIDLKLQAYCAGGSGGNIHFQTGTDGTGCVTTKIFLCSNGNVGINCLNPGVSLTIGTTDAIKIPTGTTAQRPTGANGLFRFNTTLCQPEWYDATTTTWQSVKLPTFDLQYLVIAGGGSGGVWTEQTIGYANGYQGSNSIFANIISNGGGGGRAYNQTTTRTDGGSGGGGNGGTGDRLGGCSLLTQGYSGGAGYNDNRGGGGGGAGGLGCPATSTTHGAGGIGAISSITGTPTYYAGGGGAAGAYNTPAGGAGGTGGGGAGAAPGSGPGTSGTANTGGGGGAADAYWGQSHGGGGGGGFRTNTGTSGGGASFEPGFNAAFGTPYTITVGAGGPAVGQPGTGGVANKNTSSGAGGSGIVILKIPNTYTATFSGGLTTSTNTAVCGFNIYSITAGTGTVTFN